MNCGLRALAEEVLRVSLPALLTSPFYTFMWDAATDKASRKEKGMLWVRHLDEVLCRSRNTFVGNIHLPRTDSTTETDIILKLLASVELDGKHLNGSCIGSTMDGASTNLGVNHSIMTQTTGVAIHCSPHVSQLWLDHTIDNVDFLPGFIDHLRGIATDLWSSCLKSEIFRNVQSAFGESAEQFLYAPKTRWYYLQDVCSKYCKLLYSLFSSYELYARDRTVGGCVAKGRLKQIRDIRHIYVA